MLKRLSALVASALVVLPSALVVQTSRAVAADPLPAGFVDQIKAAGADLAGVSLLDDLGKTVPGLGTNPAVLLGLHEPFGALAALAAADADQLANAVDALDGGGFEFSDVHTSTTNGKATLTFDLA